MRQAATSVTEPGGKPPPHKFRASGARSRRAAIRHLSAPGARVFETNAALLASLLLLFGLVSLLSAPALAQVGGYRLWSSTIDGGGSTSLTAGPIQVGGTLGQPDAGTLIGGNVKVYGGFWGSVLSPASPTPTATKTVSANATQTRTPSPSPTDTPPPTYTATTGPTIPGSTTHTPTPTHTTSGTVTVTPTTHTPTPTPTPTPPGGHPQCIGDCNESGDVAVNELISVVSIALGNLPLTACSAGDADSSSDVTLNEIITAVSYGLNGCP